MRLESSSLRLGALLMFAGVMLATTACSKFERLTFIRPTAERGDWEQVAPTYDVTGKGKQSSQPFTALQLVAAASASYAAGHFDQSRQQAQQAIKVDPRSGDAHTLLAAIASRSGDSSVAGDHYRKALDIAPANGAYANNYGIWLCGNGHAMESLIWFDKALADPAYPTPATALANGGACAQQAGQSARAEASWRQALALDPDLPPALAGMAGLKYARGEYLDARAFVERLLAITPQDLSALRLGAQIEQKQGDTAAAQRYLLRLQAIAPGASTAPPKQ